MSLLRLICLLWLAVIPTAAFGSPQTLYAQFAPSIVHLTISATRNGGSREEWTGTGTIISGTGLVLTAGHNSPDPGRFSNIVIKASVGTSRSSFSYDAEPLRRADDVDLAIIKLPEVPNNSFSPIWLGDSDSIAAGSEVFTLGFPEGSDLSVINGLISNKNGPKGRWQTNSLINHGHSGAPVFSADHQFIGIAIGGLVETSTSRALGINYIVPVNLAKTLTIGLIATRPAREGSSDWIQASNVNCLVFNPNPLPRETASWEGKCKNGLADGDGTVQWYQDGKWNSTNVGHFSDGRLSGIGKSYSENGYRFEGSYHRGLRYGRGTEFLSDGTKLQGIWEKDTLMREAGLFACNGSGSSVDFALAHFIDGKYRSTGWYPAGPGKCLRLLGIFLEKGHYYLYAENPVMNRYWYASDNDSGAVFCVSQEDNFNLPHDDSCKGARKFRRKFFHVTASDDVSYTWNIGLGSGQ